MSSAVSNDGSKINLLFSQRMHASILVQIASIQLAPTPSNYCNPHTLHIRRHTRDNNPTRDSEPSPVPTTKFGKRRLNGRNKIRANAKERILGWDGGMGMKKEKPKHHVSYNESMHEGQCVNTTPARENTDQRRGKWSKEAGGGKE